MTDYNSIQRRRNMVVGGFVLVAFAAFLGLIYLFGELPVAMAQFRHFNVIVNFPAAPGVMPNTPVYYCGFQVGKVVHVMAPEKVVNRKEGDPFHKVTVTLAINEKYQTIPSNADIRIMKRSMGSSYVDLQVDPQRPLVMLVPSHPGSEFLCPGLPPLEGGVGMNSEFFPREVQKKLEDLIDSLRTLTQNANDIIGDTDNKTNVKAALANVNAATQQARSTLSSIQRFSDRGGDTLEETAEKLNAALGEFQKTLASVNDGQGTAGRVINDGRLYENLLDSSQELQMALEQLKILAAEAREKGIKIKW